MNNSDERAKPLHELNETEKEVIILKSVIDTIDSIINYEIFVLPQKYPVLELRFNSHTHQKFFNIILVDFLSNPDEIFSNASYLQTLLKITSSPSFNFNNSVSSLTLSVNNFIAWLNVEVKIERFNLARLGKQINISMRRKDFICITGNIVKHNLTRLTVTCARIKKIFRKNGIEMDTTECLLALESFYEKFHNDVLNYHSSTIAEFLNNIRWAIYEYLQPEFHRSLIREKGNSILYKYQYPHQVEDAFAKECYWDIMNNTMNKPYIPKFKITQFIKMRY